MYGRPEQKPNYNERYYDEVDGLYRDWRRSVWDDSLGDTPQEGLGQIGPAGWLEVLDADGDVIVNIDGDGMVWLHHATHENGGSDEITVAGLSGLLADPQTPLAHDVSHENGGADEISVAGLSGLLADAQTPLAHATEHELGGSDEIEISLLAAVETDDTLRLAPDGLGGVEWAAGGGGGIAGIDVDEEGAAAATSVQTVDFGAGFDVTEPVAGTAAVALDLSEAAVFTDHSARHEDGGADEISITGLAGIPAELTTHAGAADPHTGYRLESADHSHASAGLQGGQFDHGNLTGLTDDDHTQYQKESEKGAASGYASLGADTLVPQDQLGTGVQDGTKFLRDDGTWQAAAGGGAPTDADYLVGTAHGSLSGEIVVGTSPGGELGGTWAAPTVDATHSGSAHHAELHAAAHADGGADEIVDATVVPSTQAFGDAASAGAVTTLASPRAHKHAMPADPVTAHVAAGDPHTGYRLESADHTHASTGLQAGTIDHGVITGLADDDHPQYALDTDLSTHAGAADPHAGYLLESLFDAKGDLISASADNTPIKLTVGANDTILMADSAAASGLKWVASAAPVAVGTGNAEGTSDDYSRASHVHAHEVGHVVHDTIWDAAGDLAVGSGADTAARLGIGADGTVLKVAAGVVGWGTDLTGAGSDPFEGLYAPGSFTLETGKYAVMVKRLSLTTTQRASFEGDSRLAMF